MMQCNDDDEVNEFDAVDDDDMTCGVQLRLQLTSAISPSLSKPLDTLSSLMMMMMTMMMRYAILKVKAEISLN